MIAGTELLGALPVAIYTTDVQGRITFYNEAAAQFWGHRPELGTSLWCGSWRLYWPDGTPLPHDQCPMAVTLREGREIRGAEAVAERPDGTRVPFTPYPTLLRDPSGRVIGAINMLLDISDRKETEIDVARLAAIVSSSDDAIVSKDLTGRITSWNIGATRIFGYSADEMVGQSIRKIIPADLQQEEEVILAKLQRGERIDHFDTVRLAKDGRRLNISVTVSPLHDKTGRVVGASKVARDVTERKRAEALQRLLFDELNHRVKNTLATIQAIAGQSLKRASSASEFVASFNGRVQALARAHDVLVTGRMHGADVAGIVREQVTLGGGDDARVSFSGPKLLLDPRTTVELALVLHELATNARKYGALSVASGHLSISWRMQRNAGRMLVLDWIETGVANLSAPVSQGFGTVLIERTLASKGGEVELRYGSDGISCRMTVPLPEENGYEAMVTPRSATEKDMPRLVQSDAGFSLRGKKILVIEDEPLIAMETESNLIAMGCEVVGPAVNLEEAKRYVAENAFHAALVDANLAGRPVHEIVATLTQKGIPFAFASGYGREGLPAGFEQAPLLGKPFSEQQLQSVLEGLFAEHASDDVIALRPKRAQGSELA